MRATLVILIGIALLSVMITPAMAADAWESDSAIVTGLSGVSRKSLRPEVFNMDGTWYLIAGEYYGAFYGWRWTGHYWESDDNLVSGLVKVGYGHHSAPTVFNKDGTCYLITGDNAGAFYGFRWQEI